MQHDAARYQWSQHKLKLSPYEPWTVDVSQHQALRIGLALHRCQSYANGMEFWGKARGTKNYTR